MKFFRNGGLYGRNKNRITDDKNVGDTVAGGGVAVVSDILIICNSVLVPAIMSSVFEKFVVTGRNLCYT